MSTSLATKTPASAVAGFATQNQLPHLARVISEYKSATSNIEADWRAQAWQRFETHGLPTRKTEQWKYTSVHAYETLLKNAVPPTVKAFAADNKYQDVFADLPSGVTQLALSDAIKDSAFSDWFLAEISGVKHGVADLVSALAADPIVIKVASSQQCLLLDFAKLQAARDDLACRQVIFWLEDLAEVELLVAENATNNLSLNLVRFLVGENAHLRVATRRDVQQNTAVDTIWQCTLNQKARADFHLYLASGEHIRHEVYADLAAENAHVSVNGVLLTETKSHHDLQIFVRHRVPNCTSEQLVKSLIAEKGVGVFNGKVYVDEDAIGTDAAQTNHNLLLAKNATMNAKPELEIYADDVACSHGSTMGELDEAHIFYLQSRGLPRHEAIALLTSGFAASVIDKDPILGADIFNDAVKALLKR